MGGGRGEGLSLLASNRELLLLPSIIRTVSGFFVHYRDPRHQLNPKKLLLGSPVVPFPLFWFKVPL